MILVVFKPFGEVHGFPTGRAFVGNPPLIMSFVLAIPKERVTGAFSEVLIPDSCVFQYFG